jgi:hypothetical protein
MSELLNTPQYTSQVELIDSASQGYPGLDMNNESEEDIYDRPPLEKNALNEIMSGGGSKFLFVHDGDTIEEARAALGNRFWVSHLN